MLLRVDPNRMELIRLRRRLGLAQRGHKLLEDKLEEMMRKFSGLLKDLNQAKEDFQLRTQDIMQNLHYCRIVSRVDNFRESVSQIKAQIIFSVSHARIMNVQVPELKVEELNFQKRYDFFKTTAQLDLVVKDAENYIRSLLRLAQLLKSLRILAEEIERTRRRVNALEYILIPAIGETIRYISAKLAEIERSSIMRLMRIKELIRSH